MQLFFQHGKTRDGFPVVYYIARRRERPREVNDNSLIVHIVRTLQPLLRKQFELVIDCAASTEAHQPSMGEMNLLKSLVRPPTLRPFVASVP